jgi:hypothetical protein
LTLRDQWLDTTPKLISDLPCLYLCHLSSTRGHRAWGVIIHYLWISSKSVLLAVVNDLVELFNDT